MMYPTFTERELEREVFGVAGKLEEMPYLSKAYFSPKGTDTRIPIRILVKDNDKLYTLFFFQSRKRDDVSDEREKNIAEMVRAYNQGARILVTGIKQRKECLEESTTHPELREIITDCSLDLGIIRVIQQGKVKEYTYEISKYKDDTILVKGDWIMPRMKAED